MSDSQTIANEFNNLFTNIGPALADKITCSEDPMSYVDNIIIVSHMSPVWMLKIQFYR